MTGGGHTESIFTPSACRSRRARFPAPKRPRVHSDLEVNFNATAVGTGAHQFHLGAVDAATTSSAPSPPARAPGSRKTSRTRSSAMASAGSIRTNRRPSSSTSSTTGSPAKPTRGLIKIWPGISNDPIIGLAHIEFEIPPIIIAGGVIQNGNNQIHGC